MLAPDVGTKEELLQILEQEKERVRERDRETQARYRLNSADKAKQNQQRYREKHKEKIQAYSVEYRARIGTTVATQRSVASIRKKRIQLAGTSPPEACVGCLQTTDLVFDHCHTSNRFRGWICNSCNKTLGFAKDDSQTLRRLADYLDAFNLLDC